LPKQQITTSQGAAPQGAYSQGLRAGDFVYVSGQGPVDPGSGKIVGDTIEEQVALTLTNVRAVLEAAGATMADVVKATVHLSDIGDFQRFNAVYAEHFPDPKPTRTTVQSVLPGIMVEIDVVAYTGA
jgi:2-iminobutanoate/2-iminopropanoate deaminase